jgi:hypothetical protein
MNYSVTVTPSNNCGSATGNMMIMVDSLSKDIPGCGSAFSAQTQPGDQCPTIYWVSGDNLATMLLIDYSTSSGDSGSAMCNTPVLNCTIENLQQKTYMFTFTPANMCGSATSCPMNTIEVNVSATNCVSIKPAVGELFHISYAD